MTSKPVHQPERAFSVILSAFYTPIAASGFVFLGQVGAVHDNFYIVHGLKNMAHDVVYMVLGLAHHEPCPMSHILGSR